MSELCVVGNSGAVKTVLSAVSSNKFPHALMLIGEKGIGKKNFADFVCSALVCTGSGKPCKKCAQCNKIEKKIHPDVFYITPAGKSETIGVNEIKVIKKNLYVKPNDAFCKIFVIVNAEQMNRFAQNAILKMIEEPPEDCFFVLTCENPQSMLPTVISRVVQMRLEGVSQNEVKDFLINKYPETPVEQAENAAKMSRGNIGLAESYLNDDELKNIYEDSKKVALAISKGSEAELCLLLGKYSKKNENALKLVNNVKLIFRDVSVSAACKDFLLSGCDDAVSEISKKCSVKSAVGVVNACDRYIFGCERNENQPLNLSAFEIEACAALRQ